MPTARGARARSHPSGAVSSRPGSSSISASTRATFTAEWNAAGPSWALLPGDATLWPQDVRLDGAPAVVVPRGRSAGAATRAGPPRRARQLQLRGAARRSRDAAGDRADLPARVGSERAVPAPRRPRASLAARARGRGRARAARHRGAARGDRRRAAHASTRASSCACRARRREVVLGPALAPEMIPYAIRSNLPARLEPDRKLRVQVRPGTYDLHAAARACRGPSASRSPPAAEPPWDDSRRSGCSRRGPTLRVVDVEGVPAVDPQQTDLPPEWRELPAYLVAPGAAMKLVERRRGDADPAPDELALERTLWLDFDGRRLHGARRDHGPALAQLAARDGRAGRAGPRRDRRRATS